jgi:DNA-binding NarL/FixJ family response regulator
MLVSNQGNTSKIRILVSDDHRLVREQLAARLSREADFEIVGVAATSRATLQELQLEQPHVLLIDPIMRDGLGLATLRQVCANFPELVIVVLTAYVDTALNMQFQQMGIRHILTKGVVSSDLLMELRAAYTSAHFHDSQDP